MLSKSFEKWQAKKAHVELFAALLRSKKLYCGGNEDVSCCCPKCLRGGKLRSESLETRWSHSLHGEVLASDEQILQRRLLWLGLKLKATCEAEKNAREEVFVATATKVISVRLSRSCKLK